MHIQYRYIFIYRERERSGRVTGDRKGSGLSGCRQRRKVRNKLMSWWNEMVCPVRRVWFAVAARVKSRKNCAGLLKLRDDIQTCGYEDVQVMWEMLRRTESELISRPPKQKPRPFWKVFVWHSHSNTSSFSINHA